ncbi:uncharacterized protein MKK02DRAFT_32293 [Dioszegia hungarica]|uniref:ENTH domain-containing protein n=1 Tax=Dioszegia hungarica TaxID=4972 RepID=A0AA38HEB8_9TREE|nr:uncharacterized protein MKK02DRAFT_32293 [Dioszegia hungarica]KAI9637451.1 hypothetical protein MKK02DRAFT_32293 [Dioszegia hungarica]
MSASLQHFGRGALRVAKNYTKGYTDTQTKVRDATSNDPWGPSGTQMNEVAQLTYNQNDFVEIMEMLDKRLNDKGKNWRHVFKALTLLDYCLHAGSENVVIYFKDNIYIIKTLKEFVYTDDDAKDVGSNVRQKAKDITNLLADEDRLRAERRSRGAMRDRMLGNIADSGLKGEEDYGGPRPAAREINQRPPNRPSNNNEEDDLRKAIEESKRMMDDEATRRSRVTQEEDDLRRAMRESEEDEARRKRERVEANQKALFDDSNNLQSNNQYTQQPQQMGFDNGYGQLPLQPQFTSYNPFHMQMMQQEQQRLQQEEYMRQQMLLEQQRQQEEFMRQQYLLQQQQQQQQQQQALMAQPTGYRSNNPFAPSTSFLGANNPGSSFTPQPQQASSSFLPVPSMPTPQPEPQQQPQQQQQQAKPAFQAPARKDDGQHAGLANLLARGREDGMDTFGNTGNLRVPTGSAFHQSNRLHVQQTGFGGNNPFGQPQQQGQQQQQQQKPAEQPFFSI